MSAVVAASLGANVDFGIFVLLAAFGFVFGFFTVRGSGINNHPWAGPGAPGAKLPDEFHQFAERQIHDADQRSAKRIEVERPAPAVAMAADDMTVDDINRLLAAEASARRAATPRDEVIEPKSGRTDGRGGSRFPAPDGAHDGEAHQTDHAQG